MAAANCAASSLLPKLRPQTWRASRHWWKLGVAWLYLIPRTMAQLMTTLAGGGGRVRMVGAGAGPRSPEGEGKGRGRGRGRLHLLFWLHLPADDPEGIGGGVVVDLDSAESLGACARRHPSLVAVIVKHHSGPAGADNRLTAGRGQGEGRVSGGEHGPHPPSGRSPASGSPRDIQSFLAWEGEGDTPTGERVRDRQMGRPK